MSAAPSAQSATNLVRRDSLTDQTVRAIRETILNGTYQLGQKLRESELVLRFQVSSSVIREALHVLQGEGTVVTRPYCGRSVFNVRPEQSPELLTMRAMSESYAAYLAAQNMTPKVADTILAAAGRFVSDQPGGYNDLIEKELAFHRTIWKASENEWLIRQLDQFSFPIFALRTLELRMMPDQDMEHLWRNAVKMEKNGDPRGHQALAQAVTSGDAPKARLAMLRHILPAPDAVQTDLFGIR